MTDHQRAILKAAEAKDVARLRILSWHEDGFVDDTTRRLVWPLLLRCTSNVAARDQGNTEAHSDEHQVELDVNRAFNGYTDLDWEKSMMTEKRKDLQDIILHILHRRPSLHYFQGYHDIASILLLVLEDTRVVQDCLECLSLHRIRDSMTPSLAPVLGYLKLIRRILGQASPILAEQLEQASTLPYFSLSWMLTLLAHDIGSKAVLARLFDAILSQEPSFMIYLASALVLIRAEQLIYMQDALAEDPALVHHSFAQLPKLVIRRPVAIEKPTFETYDPDVDVPAQQPEKTPQEAVVPVIELLERAKALKERFPLRHKAIKADDVMGPKSILFTFDGETFADTSDDDEAELVVKENNAIVLPDAEPPAPKLPKLQPKHALSRLSPAQKILLIGVAGALLATLSPNMLVLAYRSLFRIQPKVFHYLTCLRQIWQ